jgi:hypothetical protein
MRVFRDFGQNPFASEMAVRPHTTSPWIIRWFIEPERGDLR